MKKIFTLVAAAMVSAVSFAQTVIFSATPTDAFSVPGGSTDLLLENVTVVGGKIYATSQQTDAKDMIKLQGGEAAFQFTNNNTFFKIVLDNALQAGDVIGARMQSRTDTELGIFFDATDSRPNETEASIMLEKQSSQEWGDAPTYTVKEGDAICGKTTIYLFRATGKSTYFNQFKITRSSATGVSKIVEVAEDGATYNLQGVKVGSDYKGVVVKNGKKFVK